MADPLSLFQSKGVILTDTHVVYTSGRHGNSYVNKDILYTDPVATSELCRMFAEKAVALEIEVVIGPTIGAVILSQWTAYHLRVLTGAIIDSVYAEKTESGFVIRRGYDAIIRSRPRVLVVEDVVTTGGSIKQVVQAVKEIGGSPIAALALCNRGGITATQIGVDRFESLVNLDLQTWSPKECLLCQQSVPINTQVGKGIKAGT